MSLFSTKTSRCKNRCDADLQWNKDAKKGCREACKGDHTLDPYSWLNSQPVNVQSAYSYQVNQAQQVQEQAEILAEEESGQSGISPGFIVLGIALVVGIIFIIKKRKK